MSRMYKNADTAVHLSSQHDVKQGCPNFSDCWSHIEEFTAWRGIKPKKIHLHFQLDALNGGFNHAITPYFRLTTLISVSH